MEESKAIEVNIIIGLCLLMLVAMSGSYIDDDLSNLPSTSILKGPRQLYAVCVRVVSIAPLLRVGDSLA